MGFHTTVTKSLMKARKMKILSKSKFCRKIEINKEYRATRLSAFLLLVSRVNEISMFSPKIIFRRRIKIKKLFQSFLKYLWKYLFT